MTTPLSAPDGRGGIDAALVSRLVAEQFPQWADLPVVPVEVDGWDNRTYRLGEERAVRLPSAPAYAAAVAREQRWLPLLAPQLPLPVPEPLALGRPGPGYPLCWSVYRWLPGAPAAAARIDDTAAFAADLAGFLTCLWSLAAEGGPVAGPHNFWRGGPLATYDAETRASLARLADVLPAERLLAVWERALAATWQGPPGWVHGDVAAGNLLVRDGRLAAVIDFGSAGVGDPACDLVIAWTFLDPAARAVFRAATGLDEGTWARARGWALWKALLGLVAEPAAVTGSPGRRVVDLVLAEHEG